MGNKKGIRVLALVMAVVCTLTVVAAAGNLDANGDGKVTVWDLQQLVGGEDYAAALKQVLGGKGDELNPVREEDGVKVYEIWSELGLQNMAKNATKGYTFELKANIDLGGKDWTPVAGFKGTFNGNDKTISNFKITKDVKAGSDYNMGFFADTDATTVIQELHLDKADITATANANYIGAIVGTNRGDIVNCTAVSAVTDLRTGLEKSVYYGTIAGRNTSASGTITGENELETTVNITKESDFTQDVISADYVDAKTVNSKMAVFFSEELDYETKASQRYMGIAGFTPTAGILNKDLRWQDITNSTDLADPALQARRELVAAEMYEMSTVEWTPSTTYAVDYGSGPELRYYRYDGGNDDDTVEEDIKTPESRYFAGGIWSNNVWYEGGVYRGIPYNHGSSSMDRFLSMMDVKNGVYTTNSSLPATAYYITDENAITEINTAYANGESKTTTGYTVPEDMTTALVSGKANQVGFNMYIGNDCSSQAGWAWRKVSAVTGTGFANVQTTDLMFPTQSNIDTYGIQAVNGMIFENPGNADGDNDSNDHGDRCAYASNYLTDNTDYWWDTLALTSKGDLLMEYAPAGGHTRLALSDAVVIYSYSAAQANSHYSLDAELSYIVTAEQGGSGADSDGINHYSDATAATPWRSSCCVDRRMTFADLTTNTKASDGYYRTWFPITCDALRDADSAAGNVQISMTNGKVTSNFHIVSYTVNGETTYTGIAQTGHRAAITSVDLSSVAAGTSVTVRLADGKDYTLTR